MNANNSIIGIIIRCIAILGIAKKNNLSISFVTQIVSKLYSLLKLTSK